MTTEEKAELKIRIEEAVCPLCVNCALDGSCTNPSFEGCPITLFYDDLIEMIVESGHLPWMESYYANFQKKVCPACGKRKKDGSCKPREAGDCSVYTYLPTIIKVVEDFLNEKKTKVAL